MENLQATKIWTSASFHSMRQTWRQAAFLVDNDFSGRRLSYPDAVGHTLAVDMENIMRHMLHFVRQHWYNKLLEMSGRGHRPKVATGDAHRPEGGNADPDGRRLAVFLQSRFKVVEPSQEIGCVNLQERLIGYAINTTEKATRL